VSIAGPAGNQFSAGAGFALATGTAGSAKWLARGPGKLERESATAKSINSLAVVIFVNFFLKGLFGFCALKDYPRCVFKVHLKHDVDIYRILEDSTCSPGCSMEAWG
jgi:hypothetical protein